MKIVVIGSGGREHAICLQLARSARVQQVICCPGNPGTAPLGPRWQDIDPIREPAGFIQRCIDARIDHVVVGPEAPLVAGVADRIREAGIPCFGPGAAAAQLEGSKAHSKDFMHRHQIPTSAYRTIDSVEDLDAALDALPQQVVVKASGLAAGKGVIVCDDRSQAHRAASEMLSGAAFGDSGKTVVIEQRIFGPEVSVLVVVKGTDYLLLPTAQDHKPLLDGNHGPNTGGMGAFCPGTIVGPGELKGIQTQIIEPTLEGLVADGVEYSGILYVGLMMTDSGPRVLEYNCRLGDPETQPVLMRMKSDFVEILEATAGDGPSAVSVEWDSRTALCLVLASDGYPTSPAKGQVIEGEIYSSVDDDTQVFHAGTTDGDAGSCLVSGGRVLGVTALADSLEEARKLAYERASRIQFDGKFCRGDIGTYQEIHDKSETLEQP